MGSVGGGALAYAGYGGSGGGGGGGGGGGVGGGGGAGSWAGSYGAAPAMAPAPAVTPMGSGSGAIDMASLLALAMQRAGKAPPAGGVGYPVGGGFAAPLGIAAAPYGAGAFAGGGAGGAPRGASGLDAATRVFRRLYVGRIPLGTSPEELRAFLLDTIARAGHPGDHIASVMGGGPDKVFCFVEFRTMEMCAACERLNGLSFKGASLQVMRPKDYRPETQPPLMGVPVLAGFSATGPASGGSVLADGPNKIFVGGLPYALAEENIRQLLESFGGRLRALHVVRDPGAPTHKGFCFCEYEDHAFTPIAIATLNGQIFGDKAVRCAAATLSRTHTHIHTHTHTHNHHHHRTHTHVHFFLPTPPLPPRSSPSALPRRWGRRRPRPTCSPPRRRPSLRTRRRLPPQRRCPCRSWRPTARARRRPTCSPMAHRRLRPRRRPPTRPRAFPTGCCGSATWSPRRSWQQTRSTRTFSPT